MAVFSFAWGEFFTQFTQKTLESTLHLYPASLSPVRSFLRVSRSIGILALAHDREYDRTKKRICRAKRRVLDRSFLPILERESSNVSVAMSRDRKVKDCDGEVESTDATTRRGIARTTATMVSRSSEAGEQRRCSTQEAEEDDDGGGSSRRKRKKRRKTQRNKQQLQLQLEVTTGGGQQRSHALTLASSSDEVEAVGECSKRDSSSSLGGGSRHNTLRESLLTVLGKLVIWKGTRYRSATTASSSSLAPPNSPPATECIGRSTSFFSSGEFPRTRSSNSFPWESHRWLESRFPDGCDMHL